MPEKRKCHKDKTSNIIKAIINPCHQPQDKKIKKSRSKLMLKNENGKADIIKYNVPIQRMFGHDIFIWFAKC